MRITQKYTDRTYLKYNNRMLEQNAKSMEKIWRQKAYKRASEDSINASKAMIVRRNLRNLDVYDSNLKTADALFKAAESNLYTLADTIYINAQNKIEQACNGTYDKDTDLHVIATEVGQVADSALNMLNKDFAERTMFGGSNNSKPPFAKYSYTDPADGKEKYGDPVTGRTLITYNGVILNDMVSDTQYRERITEAEYNAQKGMTDADGNPLVDRVAYDKNYSNSLKKSEYDALVLSDPDSVYEELSITGSSYSEIDSYKNMMPSPEDPVIDIIVKDEGSDTYSHINITLDPTELSSQPASGEYVQLDNGNYRMVIRTETKDTKANIEALEDAHPEWTSFTVEGSGVCTKRETLYKQYQYVYYNNEKKDVPGNKPIFVDIGIGIKYTGHYEVDAQTALDVALNGAAITGYGTSKDSDGVTYSKNFVQQLFDSADALDRGDVPFLNATLDKLNAANKLILTEITTLGANQNSIEFYLEKNDDYRSSLLSRQNDIEGVDMESEIISWEANQAAYNAILQMSAKILPNSVFDFMR